MLKRHQTNCSFHHYSPPTRQKMIHKPIILHLGDPIKYNAELYEQLKERYTIVRPSAEERTRPQFIQALQEQRWGQFSAIFRPFSLVLSDETILEEAQRLMSPYSYESLDRKGFERFECFIDTSYPPSQLTRGVDVMRLNIWSKSLL